MTTTPMHQSPRFQVDEYTVSGVPTGQRVVDTTAGHELDGHPAMVLFRKVFDFTRLNERQSARALAEDVADDFNTVQTHLTNMGKRMVLLDDAVAAAVAAAIALAADKVEEDGQWIPAEQRSAREASRRIVAALRLLATQLDAGNDDPR